MAVFAQSRVKIIDQSYKLAKALSRKERTVLFRTGGYVRKVMRSRIRRRKKVSSSGGYPHAHARGGQGLKEVLFKVDRDGANVRKLAGDYTVVVGHVKYRRNKNAALPIGKTVPQLLNEGGRALMPRGRRKPQKRKRRGFPKGNQFARKQGRRRDQRAAQRETGAAYSGRRSRVGKYRPRPFRKLTMPDAIANLRLNMRIVRFG